MDVGEKRVEELLAAPAMKTQAMAVGWESGQSQTPGAEERIAGSVACSCTVKEREEENGDPC